MTRVTRGWLWLLAVLCCAVMASAQPASDAPRDAGALDAARDGNRGPEVEPKEGLRVGYAGSPPFVRKALPPDGLSLGVWRLVADGAGVSYELRRMPNVAAAIDAVAAGDLDVAVGPISITSERRLRVRFTQPYFQSRIGILARHESAGIWSRIKPFLGRIFAGASMVLILSLLGVGTVIWLLERRDNGEQFPQSPLRGIGNGMWFALVTMTTVGYGDRVPKSTAGRVVTSMWMVIALVTTSSLTAGFASAFTVLQLDVVTIERARDLRDREVAVVKGSTGAAFAAEHGAVLVPCTDFAAAVQAVLDHRAAAMVHDEPILRYYLNQHPESPLQMAPATYDPQGYGFVVRPGLKLLTQLDVAMLAAREDGRLKSVITAWLGERQE